MVQTQIITENLIIEGRDCDCYKQVHKDGSISLFNWGGTRLDGIAQAKRRFNEPFQDIIVLEYK